MNVRSKIMLADGESHEWGLSAECIRQCSVMELYRISPQMSALLPESRPPASWWGAASLPDPAAIAVTIGLP